MAITSEATPTFARIMQASVDYWQRWIAELHDNDPQKFADDVSNLHRTIEVGFAYPPARTAFVQLLLRFFSPLERSGQWLGWIPLYEYAATLRESGDLDQHIHVVARWGQLLRMTWQTNRALAVHQEAARLLASGVNVAVGSHARVYFNLSLDYYQLRQYDHSQRHGRVALEFLEQTTEFPEMHAVQLSLLGLADMEMRRFDSAEKRLRHSLKAWRKLDAPVETARALNNLGRCYKERAINDPSLLDYALKYYEQARDILRSASAIIPLAEVELNIGVIHFERHEFALAKRAFQNAKTPELELTGALYVRSVCDYNLGCVLFASGQAAEAIGPVTLAIALWEQAEDELMQATAWLKLGEIFEAVDDKTSALNAYESGLLLDGIDIDSPAARDIKSALTTSRSRLVR